MSGLPAAWRDALDDGESETLQRLEARLQAEARAVEIYPPAEARYRALEMVPPEKTRIVLVGQDPYHRPGQAMGLSFSVPAGMKVPPSLKNIFRELEADLGVAIASHGELSSWAAQGVLLLNTSLSVQRGIPGSHAKYGWHEITAAILRHVSRTAPPTVFLLWGLHAQSRQESIDAKRHLVLTSGHPSPYSAHLFLGRRHFSQANSFLDRHGRGTVSWAIGDRSASPSRAAG